jgi:hypothetical protein
MYDTDTELQMARVVEVDVLLFSNLELVLRVMKALLLLS